MFEGDRDVKVTREDKMVKERGLTRKDEKIVCDSQKQRSSALDETSRVQGLRTRFQAQPAQQSASYNYITQNFNSIQRFLVNYPLDPVIDADRSCTQPQNHTEIYGTRVTGR